MKSRSTIGIGNKKIAGQAKKAILTGYHERRLMRAAHPEQHHTSTV